MSPSERSPLLSPRVDAGAAAAIGELASGASDPTHVHPRPPPSISHARLWILLCGLWLSNFTFAVQTTQIQTLAPRISSSFGHSELASYLGSVFPLFSTAFTPVYGVLLDAIGRGRSLALAATLYGVGTLACGSSPTMGALIASRAVAGAGGAGLLTVASVITTDLVPLRERGYYQGLMMLVFGAGASVGGPASGWIADTIGWSWAFHAQLPFLILSMLVVSLSLPPIPTSPNKTQPTTLRRAFAKFDTLGILSLLSSVTCLLLGFSNHTAFLLPWSHPSVWGLLVASAASLACFLFIEARVAIEPVMPLTLFGSRQLASIYASNFMLSVAAQAFVSPPHTPSVMLGPDRDDRSQLYHIPVFFTTVLSTSSAIAGLHLLPNSIGLAFGSLVAGQLIHLTGRFSALSAIGLAMPILGIYSASYWSSSTPGWHYVLDVFPTGLGYSMFLCCSLVALIASVEPKMMPKATSVLYTVRSLGNTAGVSLSAALQQGILARLLRHVLANANPPIMEPDSAIRHILRSPATGIAALPTIELRHAAQAARAQSISWTFAAASLAACATLLLSLGTKERELGPVKGKERQAEEEVDTSRRKRGDNGRQDEESDPRP